MPNTLDSLATILYSAAQDVAAEPFGAVDAIHANFDDKGVALGDVLRVPVAPVASLDDFSPAAASSAGSDKTASAVAVEITKSKKTSWHLTGEQIQSLRNAGNENEWVRQLIAQGMRALRNGAESDLCAELTKNACRAVGTAGTTPFASDIDLIADLRKELRDNGAPMADQSLVLNTSASTNLLKLGIVQQAYAAGSDTERRSGRFLPQYGFNIVESAGLSKHTKGDGSTITSKTAAAGDLAVKINTVTSGGIKAGDIFTLDGGTTKYVSHSTIAALAADDLVKIATPGILTAVGNNKTFAIGADYMPNFAFERNAVVGVLRPPHIPENPTIEQMIISDQYGMSYLLLEIAQYGQISWELHLAWGFRVVQPEFVMTLLG